MFKLSFENLIGVLICSFLFGSIVYVYFIQDDFDFENKGVQNTGVIISNRQNSRSSPIIVHLVRGKEYKSSFVAQLPGLSIGERFHLLYNPDNPKEVYVQLWRPLFLPEEITTVNKAKVTHITEVKWGVKRPGISFEYEINGTKYSRTQEIPLDFKSKYPNLSIGKLYELEYWLENPHRAIISLDRPVE